MYKQTLTVSLFMRSNTFPEGLHQVCVCRETQNDGLWGDVWKCFSKNLPAFGTSGKLQADARRLYPDRFSVEFDCFALSTLDVICLRSKHGEISVEASKKYIGI